MAEPFIPTAISEKIWFLGVSLGFVFSPAWSCGIHQTFQIHFLLNESQCPFLSLAAKTPNFYGGINGSAWEERTRLLGRQAPAVFGTREVRVGSWEQVGWGTGPEGTRALAKTRRQAVKILHPPQANRQTHEPRVGPR